jgi:hypothetical protein
VELVGAFVEIAADAALALGLEAGAIKTERYGARETISLALREDSFRKRLIIRAACGDYGRVERKDTQQ